MMNCCIKFQDDSTRMFSYDNTTTVADAIKEIAQDLGLSAYTSFSLFQSDGKGLLGGKVEYSGFEDQDCINDILPENSLMYFRKKIFLEIDEHEKDPVFQKLLYHQLVNDYRNGNYSFMGRDDILRCSALVILGEIGYDADAPQRSDWKDLVSVSKPFFTNRKFNGNMYKDIQKMYLTMNNLTCEDAKRDFMRFLTELIYGRSVFYKVEKIGKPAGRGKRRDSILALNKSGVHFFSFDPRVLKETIQFKDIKSLGSRGTALILKTRNGLRGFRTHRVNEINAILDTYELSASPVDMQIPLPALRTAEQEKARELGSEARGSKMVQLEETETLASSSGRLAVGSSSFPDAEDAEEQPLELEERHLAAKEASLPQEPTSADVNALNIYQKLSFIKDMYQTLEEAHGKSKEDCEMWKKRFELERSERRRLHNLLIQLKGNIRVFCRCRPLSKEEKDRGLTSVIDFESCTENTVTLFGEKPFNFDHFFGPEDKQEAVFEQISPLVVSVLDGFNVCIFAYGQTGTGKTFTMEGTPDNRGVNYRTLEELFRVSKERSETMRYALTLSIFEIYNHTVRDLLVKDPMNKLKPIFDTDHYEVKSCDVPVHHTQDVWQKFEQASSARTVRRTNANELSSRSHCLLRVTVRGENLVNGQQTSSRLWLVDLAGSERLENSGCVKETAFINKSLSALREAICALAKGKGSIPSFGNDELSRMLQSSLGGDCKTLMFVQISPSSADHRDTLRSLDFACRARGVELGPASKQSIQTASKGTRRKEGASTDASAHGTGNKRQKRAA